MGFQFFEPPRKTKYWLEEIGKFEKSKVKMERLAKKGKRLLVRGIRSFEKLRAREIAIPL